VLSLNKYSGPIQLFLMAIHEGLKPCLVGRGKTMIRH
jgi:hypothetical protein